jgi:predicted acetyltransferase
LESILCVSAPPGYSEHHSGRAIDLTTDGVQPLEQEFEHTNAFRWLSANAGRFGFTLSFPPSNRYGYAYEPWHWYFEAPNTEIAPAGPKEKPLLSAMLDSNLRELGAPRKYPYFESYWSDPARYPFVITSGGRTAGFALVRRLNAGNEVEMAEFYVAPEFRRAGIGRAAAKALFARFPGKWRISVLGSNTTGALFWSQAVPTRTPPETHDGTMLFSFSSDG